MMRSVYLFFESLEAFHDSISIDLFLYSQGFGLILFSFFIVFTFTGSLLIIALHENMEILY